MKYQDNQQGFGHVQSFIALIVVIVIGVAGWWVYSNQERNDSKKDAKQISSFKDCVAAGNPVMESYPEQCSANGKSFTNPDQKAQTPPTQDETANWLLYQPPGKEYSVRLADGWKLERYQQSNSIYTFGNQNLALAPGTKATVEQIEDGKDGQAGFSLNHATQNLDQIVTQGEKQASLKTMDGIEIEKYYYVVKSEEDAFLEKGAVIYTYVIRKNVSRVIVANYSFLPGVTDYHETVEKVLKTVRFN